MQTLESLKKRIESVEDLKTVVRTMKTLAAVSIRHYERAVESLTDYFRTVEMGLQVVLKTGGGAVSAKPLRSLEGLVAIVLGSDQGLCGRFNDQIASHALKILDRLEPKGEGRIVIGVGGRAASHLEERGGPLEELFSVPNSLTGITSTVQGILLKVDEWQSKGKVDRIVLFHNKPLPGVAYRSHTTHLLPLDQEWFQNIARKEWPSRALPTFSMDRSELFSALVRQYLFVSLYGALAESLASENASRLASMQVAEKNIEEHLEELNTEFRQSRQASITSELLDIVGGFEALASEKA